MPTVAESHKSNTQQSKSDTVRKTIRLASTNDMNQNYETFFAQISETVPPVLNERFYEMYKGAYQFVISERDFAGLSVSDIEYKTIEVFQHLLGAIRQWSDERIEEETEYVVGSLKYFRSALRQMLVARVSILMSMRDDARTHANFQFEMPDDKTIVHKIFVRAAKRLRARASLYRHLVNGRKIDDVQREQNTLEAEDIIRSSLKGSIIALVPLEDVVERHFEKPEDIPAEEVAVADDDNEEEEAAAAENDEDEEDSEEATTDEDDDDDSPQPEMTRKELADGLLAEARQKDGGDSAPIPLAPEDVPADKTAAESAVMVGDSQKTVQLKEKLGGLQALLNDLRAERARTPKKQHTILRSIDEEIAAREQQLEKTKKKLKEERRTKQ